jgi:hypothetical protein
MTFHRRETSERRPYAENLSGVHFETVSMPCP